MPILNYTTSIDTHKTVGEVMQKLSRAGALAINIDYNAGEPVGLTFLIYLAGTPINYRLPSRWQGIYKTLLDDMNVPRKLRTEEQAKRIAWRITKDWVEAQLAIVEAELAMLSEVFLPYAITANGKTLYQRIDESGGQFLLGDGTNER